MTKTGRPKKPKKEHRMPLAVRLTPAERELLDDAATRGGMETSTWLRWVGLNAAREVRS